MLLAGTSVAARTMEPDDRNFIISTWLRSAKELSKIPRPRFFSLTRPQVEADLAEGVVVIACDESEPATIFGWACYRDGVLRWAYTVFDLRRKGVFTFISEQYEQAHAEAVAA